MSTFRILSILAGILFFSATACAQHFWQPINTGMDGANVRMLLAARNGSLLAGTFEGGLYRSTDNGESWQQMQFSTNSTITSIIIDSSGTITVGSEYNYFFEGYIHRSTDEGATWQRVALFQYRQDTTIIPFAATPSGELFGSNDGIGIFHSTDGGTTWTRKDSGLPNTTLAGIVLSQGNLFVAIEGHGPFRSTDAGNTWTRLSGWLSPIRNPTSMAATSDGILLVGSENGLFRSTNGGDDWKRVYSTEVGQIIVDAAGIIHISASSWLDINSHESWPDHYISTDGGTTWNTPPGQSLYPGAITTNGLWFGAIEGGIARSENSGITWQSVNHGLMNFTVQAITVAPDGTIFAARQNFIFRSTDDGTSWIRSQDSLPWWEVSSLFAAPAGEIFASTASNSEDYYGRPYGRIYRSGDNGETWQLVADTLLGAATSFAGTTTGTIIAGTTAVGGFGTMGGGLYRSQDAGLTWDQIDVPDSFGGPEVRSLAVTDDDRIFASTYGWSDVVGGIEHFPLYESRNHGMEWHPANDTMDALTLAINSRNDLYAGGFKYEVVNNFAEHRPFVRRSTDGGQSWIGTQLDSGGSVNYLTVDVNNHIYAVTGYYFGYLYRSTDDGMSWASFSDGLPTLRINALAASPRGYVLAATRNNGLYRGGMPMSSSVNIPFAATMQLRAYPNPATSDAVIEVTLPIDQQMTLKIFNLLGEEISTLIDGHRFAGSYRAHFNTAGLADGIYACVLTVGEQKTTQLIVVQHTEGR